MSGLRSFVSENEIEEQKKRRQEEWERVRTAEQPKEAPDPDYDPRSLYERLKEQREKKQIELDETQKLRHMVRGLDSEEIGFLDFVDNVKAAEEAKRRLEEKQLIEEIHKTVEKELIQEPTTSVTPISTVPKPPKLKPTSKQAQIIGVSIKRKSNEKVDNKVEEPSDKRRKLSESDSVSTSSDIEKSTTTDKTSNGTTSASKVVHVVGLRPSGIRQTGVVLPGLGGYSPTSDSSDDSDSSGSDKDGGLFAKTIQQMIQTEVKTSSATSAECSGEKIKRTISGGGSGSSSGQNNII